MGARGSSTGRSSVKAWERGGAWSWVHTPLASSEPVLSTAGGRGQGGQRINHWDRDLDSESISSVTLRSLLNLRETNFSPQNIGILMTTIKCRNVRFIHENSCKHLLLPKKPSEMLSFHAPLFCSKNFKGQRG